MSRKKKILISLGLSLVLLSLVEAGLRLSGAFAENPWDARSRLFHETFYVYDLDLGYRMPPGLDWNFSLLYPDCDAPVHINSRGYRGPELAPEREGRYRIVCLGDSVTFGFGVRERESYPRRLEALLARERSVEVVNMGVPSYTSLEGLRIAGEVAELDPDVVVVAFGFNDGFVQTFPEEELTERVRYRVTFPGSLFSKIGPWLSGLALYRFAQAVLHGAVPGRSFTDVTGLTERVPAASFQRNIEAIVDLLDRESRARLLLLNLDFPNRFPAPSLEAISEARGLPYRDMRSIFLADLGAPELRPAPSDGGEAVETVRIRMTVPDSAPLPPEREREQELFAVWVPDPSRRLDLVEIRLRDDGTGGDVKAHDGVWSAVARISPRGEIAFRAVGHPGGFGSADAFLNSHYFHSVVVGVAGRDGIAETPAYPFNQCPFRAWMLPWEDIHPNAAGCDRIAKEVAEMVREGW